MNTTALIIWSTVVIFAAIGFIAISEGSFAGQAIGFGVAGLALLVRRWY